MLEILLVDLAIHTVEQNQDSDTFYDVYMNKSISTCHDCLVSKGRRTLIQSNGPVTVSYLDIRFKSIDGSFRFTKLPLPVSLTSSCPGRLFVGPASSSSQ